MFNSFFFVWIQKQNNDEVNIKQMPVNKNSRIYREFYLDKIFICLENNVH